MKTVIKSITFIALICVAAFGAYVLQQNGDFARFFPDNTAGKDSLAHSTTNTNKSSPKKDIKKPKEKDPNAFVEPTVGNPDEIFVHANGFEYGKKNFEKQGFQEAVKIDKGKVSQISFRLKRENIPMYLMGPGDENAFSSHRLTKDGAEYCFASTAWRKNMRPYLSSIYRWIIDNKKDVIMVVNLEYSDDKDTAAEFITLRAFSLDDLGKTLSVNTTFHQYSDDGALDYKTREYATVDTKGGI